MIEQSNLAIEKITEYRNKKKKNKAKPKTVFLDMFNQEITIGNYVIVSDSGYVDVKLAKVISFTNVKVKIEYYLGTKLIEPNSCFKLPNDVEEFKKLNAELVLKTLKK